jgi:methyl-accepting chemotaxis protein
MDILGNVTQTISSAMEEMASGSTQIASAVGDVNEDSVKNRQGIESIVSQMSVFKM